MFNPSIWASSDALLLLKMKNVMQIKCEKRLAVLQKRFSLF
jgi:hypothetical protein